MESRAPALNQSGARVRSRLWSGLLKVAVGLGLLAALLFWGRIDLKALSVLTDAPLSIAICLVLVLLAIPLAALRWSILLRAFGLSIPFGKLVHFVAIGLLANLFLFGPTGGDAVRGVYAWRAIGSSSSARVAVSLLADRLFGVLGLLSIALAFTLFNWHWMRQVPALAALGTLLLLGFAACVVAASALFVAPRLTRPLEQRLSRWPRVAELIVHLHELILLFRSRPFRLLGALALAVMIHILTVAGVVVLAEAVKIGHLGAADFLFAVPLTFAVNALPLTPSGIGVGEAAFDQICRWLEPMPSGAAYSSIFFAYRAVSMVASLAGLASFVIYRNEARSDPAA
jgi:uncharacterized protein (TIRG00374 family)